MAPTPDKQDDLDLISVRPRLRPGSSVSDGGRNVRNVSSPGSGLCSAMMPAPLRRPLASTRSEVPSSSSSNIGSFEPLIPQQQQREKLTLSERDRKIAILEEELKVAKRLVELENCEQEKDRFSKLVEVERTNGSALHDFGRKLTDVFQQNSFKDDILIQIEKGRREEIENHGGNLRSIACETSDDVIKQKVSDMLGRKKLGINTVESSSQIPSFLPQNIEVSKSTTNEIFDSEEENEIDSDPLVTSIIKPSRREEKSLEASAITGSVFKDSMIGVDVMEQQFIWEKIQQERRDEEYRMRGLKDKELVQEQLEIFRQIQEQNMARKKEEELTLKLIAEMALTDQRQQMRVNSSTRGAESVLPPISSVLPPRSSAATGPGTGVGWSLVGKTSSNEKVASLKNAAALDQIRGNTGQGEAFSIWKKGMLEREEDERRRQLKNWEDGQKVKIVRNEEAFPVEDSRGQNTYYHYPPNTLSRPKEGAGAGRRELSTRRQSEGLSGVAGRRELGARRKSEGWQDAEKEQRRIAENQRRRIEAQEKEAIAKTKEVALAREWEIATRRKEARVESDKEVTQSKSKFLNQKSKQK